MTQKQHFQLEWTTESDKNKATHHKISPVIIRLLHIRNFCVFCCKEHFFIWCNFRL